MRKANLEVEYGGKVTGDISLFHSYCTICLKDENDAEEKCLAENKSIGRRKWRTSVVNRFSVKKKSPPCLICACPVCPKHGCRDFRREGITVCGHCAPLFTMDFVVYTISNDSDQHRRQCLAHMIDSYDRALLMLQYSVQYIEDIAQALENNSRKTDQIGLGSSGVGLMSGFTGVAAMAAHFVAAATILSPAGPPLLIASILFGGTAVAATTSFEAINCYSEPNQLANKILALHELVHSLLAVTTVMKTALQKGHIDVHQYVDMKGRQRIKFNTSASNGNLNDNSDTMKKEKISVPEVVMRPLVTGIAEHPDEYSTPDLDESSTTSSVESGGMLVEMQLTKELRNSHTRTGVQRATTNAMKVFQAASVACVALNAATIVLEAKNMSDTLESLRAGSPCEKATTLRKVKQEISKLPSTKVIADECESYLAATSNKTYSY